MRPAVIGVIIATALLLLALAGGALWNEMPGRAEPHLWHQEIRLVISTPDGPVEATSVQAVEARYYPNGLPAAATEVARELTGEAVVADLGGGRYLFALLPGPGLAERAYKDLADGRPAIYEAIEAQLGKPPLTLRRDIYPRLVTFTDITDPTSVALVDPDNLAASFGPGYALERITVAITSAPVTEGVVEGVLGWLREIWPNRLDGQRFGDINSPLPTANSLSANSFSTEISK